MDKPLYMVDLKTQYARIKEEIDTAILNTVSSTQFINGPAVKAFAQNLADYLDVKHVIPCANGTDALQIAMMALNLKPGDEVIVPAFTYVATAEVIALLNLKPVMVDVDPAYFNMELYSLDAYVSEKTKAIVPVHLFGQSTDMEPVMAFAKKHNLHVIEDNAQAIGARYTFDNGANQATGTIGHVGTTSFYPSKNLGCYGDGGAMFTNDDDLAQRLRMVANHGQNKKYHHAMIGVNSRLDSIQAAILNVKLDNLDKFSQARQQAADFYDKAFSNISGLKIPARHPKSTHVFHQYTLTVLDGRRDELKAYLTEQGISSMIYYPIPLYKQEAFRNYHNGRPDLPVTEVLCKSVLSLPMHTEFTTEQLSYIAEKVADFFQ